MPRIVSIPKSCYIDTSKESAACVFFVVEYFFWTKTSIAEVMTRKKPLPGNSSYCCIDAALSFKTIVVMT